MRVGTTGGTDIVDVISIDDVVRGILPMAETPSPLQDDEVAIL